MTSQINSLTVVYSTVYSGANQRKYPSPKSLAFVSEIHRWPVNKRCKEYAWLHCKVLSNYNPEHYKQYDINKKCIAELLYEIGLYQTTVTKTAVECIQYDICNPNVLHQITDTVLQEHNSLWPCDAVWWQRSWLMASSHYLNDCWFLISEVLWHSPESKFTVSA